VGKPYLNGGSLLFAQGVFKSLKGPPTTLFLALHKGENFLKGWGVALGQNVGF